MKNQLIHKLSNYFFDCSKLSFGGLVLTAFIKKPVIPGELIFGTSFTLTLVIFASIISMLEEA